MTGNNEMSLNTATMIAALQFYFDSVVFAPGKSPEVTGITTSNSYGAAFNVTVKERPVVSWANPEVQIDRAKFSDAVKAQEPRWVAQANDFHMGNGA